MLIDSALGHPLSIERADTLLDLPQTEVTETAADIPALLRALSITSPRIKPAAPTCGC